MQILLNRFYRTLKQEGCQMTLHTVSVAIKLLCLTLVSTQAVASCLFLGATVYLRDPA